jgi:hypothetical protein
MNKLLGAALALVLGVGVGGCSAYAVGYIWDNHEQWAAPKVEFVPMGAVMAPLVFEDGRLSGYASFEIELEVPSGQAEMVKTMRPVLLNAVNLRTYRTPMASGPDGLVPNLETFRAVVAKAAAETYGKDMVRRVAVTQASPV